ncbi:uncharacterized protein [Triticum aestivum]|uniref:uncharacterized protein n=1 Tax=Triticum aestivum TaxID=4565 RepID=UPI001D016626|nr:uncharacterized protein LOC123142642 [Triticum aestivum]
MARRKIVAGVTQKPRPRIAPDAIAHASRPAPIDRSVRPPFLPPSAATRIRSASPDLHIKKFAPAGARSGAHRCAIPHLLLPVVPIFFLLHPLGWLAGHSGFALQSLRPTLFPSLVLFDSSRPSRSGKRKAPAAAAASVFVARRRSKAGWRRRVRVGGGRRILPEASKAINPAVCPAVRFAGRESSVRLLPVIWSAGSPMGAAAH